MRRRAKATRGDVAETEMRNKAKNPYHFYVRFFFLYVAVYVHELVEQQPANQAWACTVCVWEGGVCVPCNSTRGKKGSFNGWENCIPQIYCQIEFFPFSFLFLFLLLISHHFYWQCFRDERRCAFVAQKRCVSYSTNPSYYLSFGMWKTRHLKSAKGGGRGGGLGDRRGRTEWKVNKNAVSIYFALHRQYYRIAANRLDPFGFNPKLYKTTPSHTKRKWKGNDYMVKMKPASNLIRYFPNGCEDIPHEMK